ncbi:peptidylprolyl isomerase [bacterium]|nr:peptidylprolyl isomerase [bacterium]
MEKKNGIMGQLRARMTIIFWVVVVLFVAMVIVQWGMNYTGKEQNLNPNKQLVAKVGEREIPITVYQNALENARQRAVDQGEEFTDQLESQIKEQTWNELVNRAIIEKEFKDKNITLGEREMFEVLKNDPPDIVKKVEAFQTDGQFDSQKFQQALLNPEVDWMPVENYLRANIPFEKLKQLIESMVYITTPEIREIFIKRNARAKVKYMSLSNYDFMDAVVDTSASRVEEYYETHKDDYWRDETVILKYLEFPIEPSKMDSIELQDKFAMIYQRLSDGEDFSWLAQQFSQDPGSAENGGSIGFFGRGQMIPEFEEAAFALDSGEVSEPVQTDFGWHIIKLDDRIEEEGTEMISASHILLRLAPSAITVDSIRTIADSIYESAKKFGIDSAAIVMNLEGLVTTPPVKRNESIEGVGYHSGLSHFVFNNPVESVYPPVAGPNSFFVYYLYSKQSEGIPPLDEISSQVKFDLANEQRKKLAYQKLETAYQKIKSGMNFFEAADELGIPADTTEYFSRSGYISGIGFEPVFIGTAFGLDFNKPLSGIVEGSRGYYYIIELMDKVEADFSRFESEKQQIVQEIYQNRKKEAYNLWFKSLRDNEIIVDNRMEYFEP